MPSTAQASVKRNGDVFLDNRYAGRVTRAGRTWAAERWVRGTSPAHESAGSGYRTRQAAVDAIFASPQPCGIDECDCHLHA
jgi:hypothetical protein